jgi:hypothetical protein
MAPGDPLAYFAFIMQVNVGHEAKRRVRTSNNQFPPIRQINALTGGRNKKIEPGLKMKRRMD